MTSTTRTHSPDRPHWRSPSGSSPGHRGLRPAAGPQGGRPTRQDRRHQQRSGRQRRTDRRQADSGTPPSPRAASTSTPGTPRTPKPRCSSSSQADTGLKVNVVRLTPNRLFERISAEYGAGKLKADVVRTSDSGFASSLSEKGVFQPYTPDTAINLHDDVVFDGGNYYRTFNPIYTFGYNNAILTQGGSAHLLVGHDRPGYEGKIGIAQVGAGGSALALTRFQRSVLGDEFLTAYAANRPRIFDSLGAELDSLARGEVQVGTTVVSAVNLAQARNAPVQFVIPKEGFAVYDYYTGIASTATHLNAAKVFMNWNLSLRGQNVFRELGEYSVRTDVDPPLSWASSSRRSTPSRCTGFSPRRQGVRQGGPSHVELAVRLQRVGRSTDRSTDGSKGRRYGFSEALAAASRNPYRP